MACVWRQVRKLAKSANSNLGAVHVKHLVRQSNQPVRDNVRVMPGKAKAAKTESRTLQNSLKPS